MDGTSIGAHPTRSSAMNRYAKPQMQRIGTFREITREGFVGNVDGGLILGPDGTTTPAADGSR